MARSNAGLNGWIVAEIANLRPAAELIVEIGSGPGVGTTRLLSTFPTARVVAVDPSPVMQRQLHRRTRTALVTGRLRTAVGDLGGVTGLRDVDIVMAVHVVYFWKQPGAELRRAAALLRPGGLVAPGFQLRDNMPAVAQRDFPASGHRLLESDDEAKDIVLDAGLEPMPVRILGDECSPAGRLLVASRP